MLARYELYGQAMALENDKNGKVQNAGTIRIKGGQVRFLQDTLGGRVEFLEDRWSSPQGIPSIVWNQLVLRNAGPKQVDSVRRTDGLMYPLETLDSLIIDNEAPVKVYEEGIYARASVKNTADVEGQKDLRMINDFVGQDLDGDGKFDNLNIDNPNGVNVLSGGFSVRKKLELTRGELRTRADANLTMGDSSWIVRHSSASLGTDPNMDGKLSIQYLGGATIASGPEIPEDTTALLDLFVENSGGLLLTQDATVNDSLLLASNVVTLGDTTNDYTLTLTDERDPIFAGKYSQVIGNFRRTHWSVGDTIFFNNVKTWGYFPDAASQGDVREMTFRIIPKTFPIHPDGNYKVQRLITISGATADGVPVDRGIAMQMGYGWRHDPTLGVIHETNDLPLEDVKLQIWSEPKTEWVVIENSVKPANLDDTWAYSFATKITDFGDYAIGRDGIRLSFTAIARLEGAYRRTLGAMGRDLNIRDYIPTTPPNERPYNLDPNRATISVAEVPDSIIDWVVLEFRNEFIGGESTYKTCFIRYDGRIVDLDGESPIVLNDSGDYYLSLMHRNHLTVITDEPVTFSPATIDQTVNLTSPSMVMGGVGALKLVDLTTTGERVYALPAGDTNYDGKIDKDDFTIDWLTKYEQGYLLYDMNMDGIITTKDYNYSWNNRTMETFHPIE